MGTEGSIERAETSRGDRAIHGVRETIERRLDRLSGECRYLLSVGSVFGSDFETDVVARAAAVTARRVRPALSEAEVAGVIQPVPGAPGQRRFTHSLIRLVVYQGLSPGQRARLHAAAAEALEALHEADTGPHVTEIANHLSLAGPFGDPAKATDYARRAGDQALAALAFEEATRQYRIALDANRLPLPKDPELQGQLLRALHEAERRARASAPRSRS